MGARKTTTTPVGNSATVLECEFCDRVVFRPCNLVNHQKSVHPIEYEAKERAKRGIILKRSHLGPDNGDNNQSTSALLQEAKPKTVAGAKIKVREMPLEKDRSASSLTPEDVGDREINNLTTAENRKVEFACPKCDKLYPVYFSCLRHIKRSHHKLVDDEDLKPVRTEMCIYCQVRVNGTEIHVCATPPKTAQYNYIGNQYYCLACKKTYLTMGLFDNHVSTKHSQNVESMFFPSNYAYQKWKNDMESQTGCKYALKGKYNKKGNTKEFYRCCQAQEPDKPNLTPLCPSTVIRQDCPKGIQVHFFPNHCQHKHKKYNLTEKYKHVSMTVIIDQKKQYTEFCQHIETIETDDFYVQFKDLMESIVIDAARVNSDMLKVLIGKALEMTTVLNNYDAENEDDDDYPKSTSIQIDPLDISNGSRTGSKRRTESIGEPNKKPKSDSKISLNDASNETPNKKLKTYSKISLNNDESNETPIKKLKTYSKISLNKDESNETPNKNLKTNTTFSLSNEKDDEKILKELDNTSIKSTSLPIPSLPTTFGKSTFSDSYKEFVDKSYKNPKPSTTKKEIFKTKIGQFKVGQFKVKSPKITQDQEPEKIEEPKKPRISNEKLKSEKPRLENISIKDIDFEIQEREDDCNILILKI